MAMAPHLAALEALLLAHQPLWQAQPFKEARPPWCAQYPALTRTLLALSDQQLTRLGQDEAALQALLAEHLPGLARLGELCAMPRLAGAGDPPAPGPHFANHVPGRKWRQITAFAGVLPAPASPFLEWCGGKGHLGRLLAWQHGQPVVTLEHDPLLCAEGERLAARNRVTQHFAAVDVLGPSGTKRLSGHHAIALHACGELHRHLLREAVAQKLGALDLAPCCYHHLLPGPYRPLSARARLRLRRDDVRLAVTGAVTASAGELRRRDREMAWKLGYLQLRREASPDIAYAPIRPIDKQWLKGAFAGFCQCLARRDGVPLPASAHWAAAEQAGWRRQRETMRLSLVRTAFARAIEVWLVLDQACFLEQHGYQVRVGVFCARALTPRNLLISARRVAA